MNKSSIIDEIKDRASEPYSQWYIGVTDDPIGRRTEHGNPTTWFRWRSDSESESREIEKIFLDLGMNGGSGGLGNAEFVYIYKQ